MSLRFIRVVGDSLAARALRVALAEQGFAVVDRGETFELQVEEADVDDPIIDSVHGDVEPFLVKALRRGRHLVIQDRGGLQRDDAVRLVIPAAHRTATVSALVVGCIDYLKAHAHRRRPWWRGPWRWTRQAAGVLLLIAIAGGRVAAQLQQSGGSGGATVTANQGTAGATAWPFKLQFGGSDVALPTALGPNGGFKIECLAGCGSPPATADNSAFTFGTTNVSPIGFVVDDVSTNTVTENNFGAPRMSGSRIMYVDLSKTTAVGAGASGTTVPRVVLANTGEPTLSIAGNVVAGNTSSGALSFQASATANGNGNDVALSTYSVLDLSVQCVGCSGGTTINFEGSDADLNYSALLCELVGTNTLATTTTTAGTTHWRCGTAGIQTVRTRISNYSAGTITVDGVAVNTPFTRDVVNANVIGTVPVSGTFWQATQPVSGTFWQATQPVSGPLTDTQLRASNVNVAVNAALPSGGNTIGAISNTAFTANAGTNLNTSALALESGGNLATVKTNTDKLDIALSTLRDAITAAGASAKTLADVVTALNTLATAANQTTEITNLATLVTNSPSLMTGAVPVFTITRTALPAPVRCSPLRRNNCS
jgi:hypothetical protein